MLPPVNKKTRLRVQHQLKQQFTAAAITRAREQMQHSTCKLPEKTNTSKRRNNSSTLKMKVAQKTTMSDLVITIGEHICVTESRLSRVLQEWIAVPWSFTAAALLLSRGRWIAAHKKKAVRVRLESAKGTATTTPVPPAIAEVERGIKS
jgi:hypothetical protein